MRLAVHKSRATTALVLALLTGITLVTFGGTPTVVSQELALQSRAIRDTVPLADPDSPLWEEAVPVQVPLTPQNITTPMLLGPSIHAVEVRSIQNGTWIAFRLEWQDETQNMSTQAVQLYRDAAAIMLPVSANQTFLGMGEPGKPVNIWHWKADWQADVDTAFQDLEQAYPNMWVDYYPFAVGAPPFTIPPLLNLSQPYSAGWAAGNPLSNPAKVTPIEDLIAEGFGTLTTQAQHDVVGRGVWQDGVWRVVFARPLATADGSDAQLQAGAEIPIAFAVWDGGNREVDGRKSFSNWHKLSVEAPLGLTDGLTVSRPMWQFLVVGAAWLVGIAILLGAVRFGSRKSGKRT